MRATARMRIKTFGMRNAASRRIALVYPASVPWIARCLDGIRQYADEQGGWHLFSSPPTLRGAEESALTLRAMRGWKGDAIIAATNDESELRAARTMGIPMINLAGGLAKSFGIPRVMVDHAAAGRMAAEHLVSRGLRHLAFFGWRNLWYSEQRCRGFMERAAAAGIECDVFLQSAREESNKSWPQRVEVVTRWLVSLPRPTGILAVHDYRAQFLMEACHEAGLRIPEDIAVVGMDNDETICAHSLPKLSSVSRNSERVGREAAALLDRMMRGEPAPAADLLVPPDQVVTRQSTDKLYSDDPLVQRALDFLGSDLRRQFNVGEFAAQLGVSKRTLEVRFREKLRSSPHEFVMSMRVRKAQALMHAAQECTIEEIAAESGFGSVQAFRKAFQRATGENPKRYFLSLASREPSRTANG